MSAPARASTALTAGLLIVFLAGCTYATQPVPPATPSVPASATPSAPIELRPLANGDCAHVLDPALVAASLGGSTNATVYSGPIEIGIVGGLSCVFNFGEEGGADSSEVHVDVGPLAIALPGEFEASRAPEVCDHGTDLATQNAGCTKTDAVAGWWYTLRVFRLFGSAQAQQASFESIAKLLTQSLEGFTAPVRSQPFEPFDCKSADTEGIAVTGSRPMPAPEDGAIYTAAARLAAPETCTFTTAGGKLWSVDVYKDSASAFELCKHSTPLSGSTVSVPGVESAYALTPDEGAATICATDGTSTVSVTRSLDLDTETGISDPASLAIVSSLAVPVLTAAD